MTGPIAAYRQLLDQGVLVADGVQGSAVETLESLSRALAAYRPVPTRGGWLEWIGISRRPPPVLDWRPNGGDASDSKQGIYLFGDVGRGKSTLMDLFFASAPVAAKRRAHFFEFMQDVHARLFKTRRDGRDDDPIPTIAGDIARETTLLCFDEVQVTDIGDAMILGRLFETLLALGVVIVATSNRRPSELYKNGLKRDRFLPFIAIIETRFELLELPSARDYRQGRPGGMAVYLTPPGPGAEAELEKCFSLLAGGAAPMASEIRVRGRVWRISRAAPGVAWFTFEELCARERGPDDFLELARLHRAVLVSDVPLLSPERRNEARRFAILVATLYEHRAILACSAEGEPHDLYPAGDGAFEFQSTASRLMEMRSEEYLCRALRS